MSAHSTSADAVLGRIEDESGLPLTAMLEISDRCNEVCVHCYQVQGQKGERSTTEWRQTLDELAELGVLIVTISGGEATLRPDFLEIVAYARRKNFLVRIFTNGLRMTRELAEALRALSVFEVEISVYSTRADMHDFVTGVPGSFERTVEGVRRLAAVGVPVTIKTVIMSVNQAELGEYPAFAQALGAHFRLDPGGVVAREGYDLTPTALNPDAGRVAELECQVAGPAASGVGDPDAALLDELLCGAGRSLHVEPNGELRPCTILEVDLGNLSSSGVRESYESETARAMRALRRRDVHGCRDCDLARLCSRCHASSLAETGDALGPYPSACAAARFTANARTPDSELQIIADNGRDPSLGPYRRVRPGVYETVDDIVTPADRALRERLGWVVRSGAVKAAAELAVRPGELVQIRRPGRKSPRLERVPGGPPR